MSHGMEPCGGSTGLTGEGGQACMQHHGAGLSALLLVLLFLKIPFWTLCQLVLCMSPV